MNNGFEPLDKELLSKRLTTITEICREIGRARQNFFNSFIKSKRKSKKYPPFPEPVAILSCGNIYDREEVMKYLEVVGALKKAQNLDKKLKTAKKKIIEELQIKEEGEKFIGLVNKAKTYEELRNVYEYICGQIEFPYIKF